MSVSAIIVAGGKGERMKTRIRKQYLVLDGMPILSRTLLSFAEIPGIEKLYLVVPEDDFDFCIRKILPDIEGRVPVELVAGGKKRQESVFNGLTAIPEADGIVAIHDGVRPFVPVHQTVEAIRLAGLDGACILGIPAIDTLKTVDPEGYIVNTLTRSTIWQAQTPQVFQLRLIRQAHAHSLTTGDSGTDDASLVENIGRRVRMIPGSPYNIKITRQEDLEIASGIVSLSVD